MYQNRSADRNVENQQTETLYCQTNVNPKDTPNDISRGQLINVQDSDVFLKGETRRQAAHVNSNASIKVSSLSLEQQ